MSGDKEFGRFGEEIAGRYLARRGYKILDKNYRTKSGELDIVAMDGRTLVFVEVKSRRSQSFGTPGDAVDARKRRRMEKAALAYISEKNKGGLQCRFDVIGVTAAGGEEPEIELVKDAFELAGGY